MDWEKFEREFRKGYAKSRTLNQADPKETSPPTPIIDPAVFRQYLHSLVSGAWKDARGIYFELTVE